MFFGGAQSGFAQGIVKLYDGPPPGSESWSWEEGKAFDEQLKVDVVYNVTTPTLEVFLPSEYKATGTAVVIAPGGGFKVLAMEHEGRAVARMLVEKGIAAFVLKYRVGHTTTDSPFLPEPTDVKERMDPDVIINMALEDGLEAVKYVRSNASKYDLHPDQIGILGFSAGGTIALSVAYNSDQTSRPNFVVPVYPYESAIVSGQMPDLSTPIFVTVAGNDEYNMMPMALNIYQKWNDAGQPAELHVYERGKHGFGMLEQGLPIDTWSERLLDWLRSHGLREKLKPSKFEMQYGEETIEKWEQHNLVNLGMNFGGLQRYQQDNLALQKEAGNRQYTVMLGNSITDAWASIDSAFYAQNNLIGRGISGQTSEQLLLRFRQDVIDLKPGKVVIHIGTNDVAENTGPYDQKHTLDNIESMIDLAEANNIEAFLASVLPATDFQWRRELGDRSDEIVQLNEGIQQIAERRNLRYIDYHTPLKNDQNGMDPDLAEDGVHPTQKAYLIMGQLLLDALK